MKRFTFPSLTSLEIGYALETDRSAYSRAHPPAILATWAGVYPTYGHGLTQHGPDTPVLSEPQPATDYLGSLVAWLLSGDAPPDAMAAVAQKWPRHLSPSVADVRFALTVKYREDKPRYYSLSEKQVSGATSKQHDRRWQPVPEWADGGVHACFRLCRPDYALTFLDIVVVASDVLEHFDTLTGSVGYSVSHLLELDWPTETGAWAHFRAAFRAVQSLVVVHDNMEFARRVVTSLTPQEAVA